MQVSEGTDAVRVQVMLAAEGRRSYKVADKSRCHDQCLDGARQAMMYVCGNKAVIRAPASAAGPLSQLQSHLCFHYSTKIANLTPTDLPTLQTEYTPVFISDNPNLFPI